MIDKDLLRREATVYGANLDAEACEKFDRYAELLTEWNEKMNLTAIRDPQGVLYKHFVDSLTALPLLPHKPSLVLIDVGTGAGFPGLPLAIVRKDIRLTLLDSLNKRLTFLKAVCDELGIDATLVHARAEEGGRLPAYREGFDVAVARAVAALPMLAEYCLPFVRVGGRFLAMKGPESDAECVAAFHAVTLLGGGKPEKHELQLPTSSCEDRELQERRIFVIEKKKRTPPVYPRSSAKIAKAPL